MKNHTKDNADKVIALIDKAKESDIADDAVKFSQAAMNAANALDRITNDSFKHDK